MACDTNTNSSLQSCRASIHFNTTGADSTMHVLPQLDWESLKELAGDPPPRLFQEKERLFGAKGPLVHLWHDSAAWHPFANQIMILLEEMRLPHVRSSVPLPQYQKPSDRVTFQSLGIKDVPVVQLVKSPGAQGHKLNLTAPLKERTAVDICRKLNGLFPDYALMPRSAQRRAYAEVFLDRYPLLQNALYGVIGQSGSQYQASYISMMDEFDGAWSGSIDSPMSLSTWGDDGDGRPEFFGGSVQHGPYLFGSRPCAVDVILLPLLERCQANVPHPLLGKAPELGISRWPALARLQAAARLPGAGAYSELGTDEKTTVGIRLGVTQTPSRLPTAAGFNSAHIAEAASDGDQLASRHAAAQLAANHAAVARFSCSGAGVGRARGGRQASTNEMVEATDDVLRAVTMSLLNQSQMDSNTLFSFASQTAHVTSKAAVSWSEVASALVFLAANIGVPRDMTAEPARAFRAHLMLLAGCLDAAYQMVRA